jgi:proteasome lid subunit RPN8/RPN11
LIKCTKEIEKAIREFGEQEYPNECCGLLFGKINSDNSKEITEILPISNAQKEENRYNRFLITPKDMIKGELYARKHNVDIIGFYHSHPNHPAKPSQFDLDHAWPVYSYIIVSVANGKADLMTSWILSSDRAEFEEEEIN